MAMPAEARMSGGHGHGGGHPGFGGGHFPSHFHDHGPRVFIDGGFFDPFFYPFYPVPYPYWGPPYVPYDEGYPDDGYAERPPPPDGGGAEENAPPADEDQSTYGLVQLRGVPDGAAVDLDRRYWLRASGLDDRWLALPSGSHTITVRVEGYEPVERRLDVTAGGRQAVRVGPLHAERERSGD
jgi:hypothetical protein